MQIRNWIANNQEKVLAWTLGCGLALYALHWQGQPAIEHVFLPALGLMIIAISLLYFFMSQKRVPSFGQKYIWIPMLIIIGSMAIGVATNPSMTTLAGLFFGITMFATYVAARQLGKRVFIVFIPFVAIVAASVIYEGVRHPGVLTGGIITNYCASAGFMIFGTIVNKFKWQWVLATLVLIALFFTGAAEVLIILGALGIVMLIRRDWNKKALIAMGILAIIIAVWTLSGNTKALYNTGEISGISNRLAGVQALVRTELLGQPSQINGIETREEIIEHILSGRWIGYKAAIERFNFFGNGFWPSVRKEGKTVHNVPLIITDQIGVLAALAWLFIGIICFVKTKWRYAWAAVFAMSIFDHYIWTQFAPYWWALAGVSSASSMKTDLIFRRVA